MKAVHYNFPIINVEKTNSVKKKKRKEGLIIVQKVLSEKIYSTRRDGDECLPSFQEVDIGCETSFETCERQGAGWWFLHVKYRLDSFNGQIVKGDILYRGSLGEELIAG